MTCDTEAELSGDENDLEQTEDEAFYDYYLFSKPGVLASVVSKVIAIVEQYETKGNLRTRKRKPADQRSLVCSVDSIVSNVADVFLRWGHGVPVIVSRRKDVNGENTNKNLPQATFLGTIDLMEGAGLLSKHMGVYNGHRSTIAPSPVLQRMILSHGVDLNCFRECSTRPLLVLRRSFKGTKGRKGKRELVRFAPTAVTDRMVAQVERLNAFLATADIDFVSDGQRPVVTPQDRTMVRYFSLRGDQSIRFNQNGRLFGRTFWLGLKSERRGNIRIDGEPVADLDFANLGPRLGYAMLGQEAPEGDLYDLTGLLAGYDHRNDDHRKAIKRAFASCLNGGRGGKRGIDRETGKPGILDPLPRGVTAEKVRTALLTKHPDFTGFFEAAGVPVGFTIMFNESRILLYALERLMDAGVVALPFHDGVMVAASKQGVAKEALEAASKEVMGVVLPVELKADYGRPEATEELLAA